MMLLYFFDCFVDVLWAGHSFAAYVRHAAVFILLPAGILHGIFCFPPSSLLRLLLRDTLQLNHAWVQRISTIAGGG